MRITADEIVDELAALGDSPRIKHIEDCIQRIAAVEDDADREGLFNVARDGLHDKDLRAYVGRARMSSREEWKHIKHQRTIERVQSDFPLPSWGAGYAKYKDRTYVWSRHEHGGLKEPLHTPLRIKGSFAIESETVQDQTGAYGGAVEIETPSGERVSLEFARSDAFRDALFKELADAGVGTTKPGRYAIQDAVLEL
jgi:hypothetical protein